jgi:hypothetical protein
MDQQGHSVFDNSMRRPWPITYGGCHSVFIDDIKVYNDSVFADDLWFSTDIEFLTIPCVSHDSFFCYRFDASVMNSLMLSIPYVSYHLVFIDDFDYSDNSMRQPWFYFCYRFDASVLNSLTLSISYVGCHLVFVDDFMVYSDFVFAEEL